VTFDLTTSILEALNFLVLVWLLKRFFYRPVLEIIEKRQRANERIIADAEARRREAEILKSDYEQRLANAGRERELALAKLSEEIAGERVRRLGAVEAEAAVDRQRRQLLEEREAKARESARERQAIAIAVRFASRLLDRLAGPELEAKLLDLALDELGTENSAKLAGLSAALREADVSVKVITAYPLDAGRRGLIKARLGKLAGTVLEPAFSEDATLTSGLCMIAGSWVLMANLRDELRFFAGDLSRAD
jgi:F-type H+-transporting ATPase subunit b